MKNRKEENHLVSIKDGILVSLKISCPQADQRVYTLPALKKLLTRYHKVLVCAPSGNLPSNHG